MTDRPQDPAEVLRRAINHAETALELAGVQGSAGVTLSPIVVRALLGASKSLGPLCDIANAADHFVTTWSKTVLIGVEHINVHDLFHAVHPVVLALGKKLFDALPEQQKQAFQAAVYAMDQNGNMIEDLDGNPIVMDPAGLERLDKIAISPVGDLIEKAERLFLLLVKPDTRPQDIVLNELDVATIIPALLELRTALERMTPWRLRRPQ